MAMVELGAKRANAIVDLIVTDDRRFARELFSTKCEAAAVIVSVQRRRAAETLRVLRFAQMWRFRFTRGREFKPVVGFSRAIGIKRRASLRRFPQVTGYEL